MAQFSDDFTSDPAGHWTDLWNAASWNSGNGTYDTGGSGGSFSVHDTATGSVTQYAKCSTPGGALGGLVLRSTGTASDGYYIVLHDSTTAYLFLGGASGIGSEIDNDSLAFATGDAMAVTIEGTDAATTVRVWKNPATNTPTSVSNWSSASDPPAITLTGSASTTYNTGQRIGFGLDSNSVAHDNFYGGGIDAATSLDLSVADTSILVTSF